MPLAPKQRAAIMSIKKRVPGRAQLFEGRLGQIRVKFSFKLFFFFLPVVQIVQKHFPLFLV